MEKVYLLYSCDAWLSTSSLECMGTFATFDKLVESLQEYLTKTLKTDEVDEMIKEIKDNYQTQGHRENWMVQVMTLNEFYG